MNHVTSAIAGTLVLPTAASAAWTTVNQAVADRSGEQAQPKIVATSDGGAYISWFDNSSGGYDVYLQRLDDQGDEVWAHNGVLVADRSFSSTQDYGLAVDAGDNALLAFRDDRFTGVQITAALVQPDGTLAWGANGVQLTADTAFHAAPGVAATTDGDIVVAWTNDTDVKLQRLDAAGAPQWGAGITLSDGAGGEYLLADIHGGDAGSIIVSWNRQQTFLADKHIYCQKLDTAGAAIWNGGAPVIVFDGGSLQFGNFPKFIPDGSGGAVFGWYSSSPSLQCFAQRIAANGTEVFPHNGVSGSTNAAQNRVSPDVAYNPGSGETFLFWTETNAPQSMFGVSGQRFDASGNRLWGASGQVVLALGTSERTWVRAAIRGAGAIVSYLEGTTTTKRVQASALNADGTFAWVPTAVTVSDMNSGKSRLAVDYDAYDRLLHVWQDDRNDVNDIFAQNLNSDGSLGVLPCDSDVDGDNDVDVDDLVAVIIAWGTADPDADVDGNGIVDVDDLVQVILNWGC